MTQPIQEPTDQRAIAGMGWAQSQLARRPPLVTAGGIVEYAWIEHTTGSTSITTDTAYNIVNDGGPGANPYDDGFVTQSNSSGFTVNLTTGVISYAEPGLYYWHGSLQVNSDIDGVDFTPILNFPPGANRYSSLNHGAGDGGGGVTTTNRWAVDAVTYYSPDTIGNVPGLNTTSANLLIFQNSGGDWSAEEFVLFCVRLNPDTAGVVSS